MDKTKILIISAIVVVVLIVALAKGSKPVGPQKVSLEFWGIYDGPEVYTDFINAYQEAHENVEIHYRKMSFDSYEEELLNALATGKGPDIFSIHNTWLPKYKDALSPMPQLEEFMIPKTYQETFVDVAYADFVDAGLIYAIPFYVDTLALYYNKDFVNSAGIPSPPTTWDEFLDDVELLTKKDKWGNIERSGAALGTAENINRSTDVLSLLMLQTGAQMVDANRKRVTFNQASYIEGGLFNPGKDALRFYTDFSNPTKRVYTWNRQMIYSIDAFYEGKTAMMINYSYHIATIREKSPYLNFGISPVPQIKDRKFDVDYANYWGQAVYKGSKYADEAWKFLLYLSSQENLKNYLEKTKRPTSRRDLVDLQRNDQDLGAFAVAALSARSWYQIDSSHIEKIFANMVESVVLGGQTVDQAINKAVDQINLLMK